MQQVTKMISRAVVAAGAVAGIGMASPANPQINLPNCGGDICNAVQKGKDAVTKPAEKAAGDIANTARQAEKDIEANTSKGLGDAITAIQKAGADVTSNSQKALGDTVRTIQQAGGDTLTTVQKANGDTITTIQKAGGDVVTTYVKAGSDTVTTVDKGWKDTSAQAQRSAKDVIDADATVRRFTQEELQNPGKALTAAQKRVREGKFVDAVWGLGTDPLQQTSHIAARAAQESAVLNTIGSIAADVYGGPGGAAAYAAWYTYETTGDASLALKIGLIEGAKSYGLSQVSKMPSGTTGQLEKKVLVAGTVGGIAVAFEGGDKNAVTQGFIKSGGLTLMQDQYDKVPGAPHSFQDAKDLYNCVTEAGTACLPLSSNYLRDSTDHIMAREGGYLDEDGNRLDDSGNIIHDQDGQPIKGTPKLKADKVIPDNPNMGKWSNVADANPTTIKGGFVASQSRVPGTNAVELGGGRFMISSTLGSGPTVSNRIPSVVVTRWVNTSPIYEHVTTSKVDASSNSPGTFDTAKSPQNSAGVSEKAVCKIGKDIRSVGLKLSAGGCEVTYRTVTGTSIPWRAAHNKDYCMPKANMFVRLLEKKGLQCSSP